MLHTIGKTKLGGVSDDFIIVWYHSMFALVILPRANPINWKNKIQIRAEKGLLAICMINSFLFHFIFYEEVTFYK